MRLYYKIINIIQSFFFIVLIAVLYLLGIEYASLLLGWIFLKFGPHFCKYQNVILKNLAICLPKVRHHKQIASKAWQSLGQVIAESIFWTRMSDEEFHKRVIVDDKAQAFSAGARILLSGHLSNFEIMPSLIARKGLPLHALYRKMNNPYLDKILMYLRSYKGLSLYSKHDAGSVKALVKALEKEQAVGMLIDQKLREGVDATLFGKAAKTTALPAKLASKYSVPIFIVNIKRIGKVKYYVTTERLYIESGETISQITQKINNALEVLIKENPTEWFWMHRRFHKSEY